MWSHEWWLADGIDNLTSVPNNMGAGILQIPQNYIFGRDKGVCEQKNPRTHTHTPNWGAELRTPWLILKVKDYHAPFISQLVIFTMLSAMFVHTSRTCCRGHSEEACLLNHRPIQHYYQMKYWCSRVMNMEWIFSEPLLASTVSDFQNYHLVIICTLPGITTIPCFQTDCVPLHFLHQKRLLIMDSSSCWLILQLIVVVCPRLNTTTEE